MRITLIISFILFCIISNAQERKDTIRMKDGSEIRCQILKASEPDSIIQFCVRENGELKVKKIQFGFVDSYSWPGKRQADTYCKMLRVKSILDGEIYNGYWYTKPSLLKPELTSMDLVAMEIKKGHKMLHIGFAVTTFGFLTVTVGPYLLQKPMGGGSINSLLDNVQKYNNQYKAIQLVGYGIAATGVIVGLASITHFNKAKLLQQESQKGLSIVVNSNGLCLAFKF